MEKESSRKNSHQKVREITSVAEAEQNIVVIPVILKIAEVELEVTICVGIQIRHPVVAVRVRKAIYEKISIPLYPAPAKYCISF